MNSYLKKLIENENVDAYLKCDICGKYVKTTDITVLTLRKEASYEDVSVMCRKCIGMVYGTLNDMKRGAWKEDNNGEKGSTV